MGVKDLSNRMEAHAVNNPNGWGEDIDYTPRIGSVVPTRALPMTIGSHILSMDKKHFVDKKNFLSVTLAITPKSGDTILHLGVKWVVESFSNSGSGMFDIQCETNKVPSLLRDTRMN